MKPIEQYVWHYSCIFSFSQKSRKRPAISVAIEALVCVSADEGNDTSEHSWVLFFFLYIISDV